MPKYIILTREVRDRKVPIGFVTLSHFRGPHKGVIATVTDPDHVLAIIIHSTLIIIYFCILSHFSNLILAFIPVIQIANCELIFYNYSIIFYL